MYKQLCRFWFLTNYSFIFYCNNRKKYEYMQIITRNLLINLEMS